MGTQPTIRLVDDDFHAHAGRYITQCTLAVVAIGVVLLLLDTLTDTTIIAALGASSFIAFAMPHKNISKSRYLIGGYLIGTLAGVLVHYVPYVPLISVLLARYPHATNATLGALAVGLTIFLMVVTNTEHPPAAGLALGFVLNDWTYTTVLVVLIGIVTLAALKRLLKPMLIDLT